jgi:hypothetical protein
MSTEPNVAVAVRTLVFAGFTVHSTDRNPGYALIQASRFDEFGARQRYTFALAENLQLGSIEVDAATISADHNEAELVVIGETTSTVPNVSWLRFGNLFGGAVTSSAPLDDDFAGRITELGLNRLPGGLVGRPDDLFELYAHAALEFTLGGRVLRYGQERRFEARPDGLALLDDRFRSIYDAKASENGYETTAESIRQFKSYVELFMAAYESYIPRIHSFIVISGKFAQGDQALRDRSRDFRADTGVSLCFVTVSNLLLLIDAVKQAPSARRIVNWSRIFSETFPDTARVTEEIMTGRRDQIVPRL